MVESELPEEFTVKGEMYRNEAIKKAVDRATPPNDVTIQIRSIELVESSDVYEDDDGIRVKDYTFKIKYDGAN